MTGHGSHRSHIQTKARWKPGNTVVSTAFVLGRDPVGRVQSRKVEIT